MSETFKNVKFTFSTFQELKKFIMQTKTEHAEQFYILMKDNIKMITFKSKASPPDVYYYEEDTKLWILLTRSKFTTYLKFFYNKVGKQINAQYYEELSKNAEEIGADKNLITKLNQLIGLFDSDSFYSSLESTMDGLFEDQEFIKKLDNKKEFMPIKNGKKIDLRTLEISDRNKDDYFTFFSDVEYVLETPIADNFFNSIMPNEKDRERLRRILGYQITGETFLQYFFIWYGSGRNGKSLLIKCIEKILSKFYVTCDKKIFVKSKCESATSPEKLRLLGKRFASHSEGEAADKMELDFSTIKQISGEDEISCRGLYTNTVEFRTQSKLNFLSNYTPPLDGQTAIRERLQYIFFDVYFTDSPDPKNPLEQKKDKNLEKVLLDNINQIFSWIVKGSKLFYEEGKITTSREHEARTDDLVLKGDSYNTFKKNKIVSVDDKKQRITNSVLFEKYCAFCKKNSQQCKTRKELYARMEQDGFTKTTYNGYESFTGIIIKEDNDDDSEDDTPSEKDAIYAKLETITEENKQLLKDKHEHIEEIEKLKKEIELLKQQPIIIVKEEPKEEPKEEKQLTKNGMSKYIVSLFENMDENDENYFNEFDEKMKSSKGLQYKNYFMSLMAERIENEDKFKHELFRLYKIDLELINKYIKVKKVKPQEMDFEMVENKEEVKEVKKVKKVKEVNDKIIYKKKSIKIKNDNDKFDNMFKGDCEEVVLEGFKSKFE